MTSQNKTTGNKCEDNEKRQMGMTSVYIEIERGYIELDFIPCEDGVEWKECREVESLPFPEAIVLKPS